MSSLLEQLEQSIRDSEAAAFARKDYYKSNELAIGELLASLPTENVVRVSMDTSSVDLSISGDYEVLKALFHTFRTAGYEPNDRPEPETMSYSSYLYCDGKPTIWLSFSSTVCKRVKVGTEMQEVDIYEVQCE